MTGNERRCAGCVSEGMMRSPEFWVADVPVCTYHLAGAVRHRMDDGPVLVRSRLQQTEAEKSQMALDEMADRPLF